MDWRWSARNLAHRLDEMTSHKKKQEDLIGLQNSLGEYSYQMRLPWKIWLESIRFLHTSAKNQI